MKVLTLCLPLLLTCQFAFAVEPVKRTLLTAQWHANTQSITEFNSVNIQPLPLAVFLPQGKVSSFTDTSFEGNIVLTPNSKSSNLALKDENELYDFEKKTRPDDFSSNRKIIPTLNFDFVQQGDKIIPSIRRLKLSENKHWDYILGVGKIWQEQADQGLFRVAMPVALVEKNQNCVHNGVVSFLLNEKGISKGIASNFYYQISSETCIYYKADLWGSGSVEYQLEQVESKAQIIARYQQEQQSAMPVKPLAVLKKKFPQLALSKVALSATIKAADMSRYGVTYQGQHFISACNTRAGNYPFCQQLVLPSYSTAKSLFGGITMMHLAKQFPDVFNEKVTDWVKECSGKQWQGVTFSHLLNMSTGNYISSGHSSDEGAEHSQIFFGATTHQEKINYSCQHFSRKSTPGTKFVYHTADTYLLGTALNVYIKAKLGEDADIFDHVLADKIWSSLSLSAIAYSTRRTSDNDAQAFTGYGLFFIADDVAKLLQFISEQATDINSRTTLNSGQLALVLQKERSTKAMKTNYDFIHYQHGFWRQNVSKLLNCTTETWLPYMLGYGGITMVLVSKELQYYYFSDSDQYSWREAIETLNTISPICTNIQNENQ